MSDVFEIVDITDWTRLQVEQIGSKGKDWYKSPNDQRWLFKYASGRETSQVHGEAWAEKVAAEMAQLLGLPHAHIELARCGDQIGCISEDFVSDRRQASLVHGNELLQQFSGPDYPAQKKSMKISAHTVERVLSALRQSFINLPQSFEKRDGILAAPDLFIGYLMFDAVIANADRHHENWGVIRRNLADEAGQRNLGDEAGQYVELAPTYDHASSLGRNLSDSERRERLTTKDQNRTLEAFIRRATSRLYAGPDDKKPQTPLGAFRLAVDIRPAAAAYWRKCLTNMPARELLAPVGSVPKQLMSTEAREFVSKLVTFNREQLLV